jgi:hypothetical protein
MGVDYCKFFIISSWTNSIIALTRLARSPNSIMSHHLTESNANTLGRRRLSNRREILRVERRFHSYSAGASWPHACTLPAKRQTLDSSWEFEV